MILWTRHEPAGDGRPVAVSWVLATRSDLGGVVCRGSATAHSDADWTVRVDVAGLRPATTYYYRFTSAEGRSVTGRTRTAPASSDHLRFAVASCARYATGYFHAYRHIAARADLDVVIHLGDYIYEKPGNYLKDPVTGKTIRKDVRSVSQDDTDETQDVTTVTLAQYRDRYACYRRDPDLAELHRQHPMICLWDDHEFHNDPHLWNRTEPVPDHPDVTWDKRVAMARRAHSEWLPMRDETTRAYRALSYGDLATIVLTDRQRRYLWPTATATNGNYLDDVQSAWLDSTLAGSRSRWTVLGAQTAFGPWRQPTDEEPSPGRWRSWPARSRRRE